MHIAIKCGLNSAIPKGVTQIAAELGARWNALSDGEKRPFLKKAERLKAAYKAKVALYKEAVEENERRDAKKMDSGKEEPAKVPMRKLFNQVVRLLPKEGIEARTRYLRSRDSGAVTPPIDVQKYEYYFVLTYIPDLQWCRLAPMVRSGVFGDNIPNSDAPAGDSFKVRGGQPYIDRSSALRGNVRWMLAPENKAQEIDVSASRCSQDGFKINVIRRTKNADEEEWDIQDAPGYIAPKARNYNPYKQMAGAVPAGYKKAKKNKSTPGGKKKRGRGRPRKYPRPDEL